MQSLKSFFYSIINSQEGTETKYYLPLFFLLLFSLFFNVGQLPLIEDEGIRALVALEMEITGDFITPRLGGELYFNKPPVYNWIIHCFFKLFGNYSEFALRFPVLLSFIVFGFVVFYFSKQHFGHRFGIIAFFLFITTERIFFYESLYGLIDTMFSMFIYLNFMLIYHYYYTHKFNKLFFISYLITALCFMLKSLPALAFQSITLLVVFISGRNFKKLFLPAHFIAIFMFLIITGLYYVVYYWHNPDYITTLLSTIFNESAKRTTIEQEPNY